MDKSLSSSKVVPLAMLNAPLTPRALTLSVQMVPALRVVPPV